jgi:hypothetical protein
MCDEARRRGVRVEQLIVLLKELWAALPPDPAGDGRGIDYRHCIGGREVLEGIVRACIEEFYAPQQAGAGQSAARASTDAASPEGASTLA